MLAFVRAALAAALVLALSVAILSVPGLSVPSALAADKPFKRALSVMPKLYED